MRVLQVFCGQSSWIKSLWLQLSVLMLMACFLLGTLTSSFVLADANPNPTQNAQTLVSPNVHSSENPAAENHLSPFFTDGCSNWMDGPFGQPYLWRHCCVAHDKAYWLGGTEAQRKAADDALSACIQHEYNQGMANYMYFMVRWGGSPLWYNWYRWGYGWNYLENGKPRGYKTPTPEEQKQIDELLPRAEETIREDERRHPKNDKWF